MKRRTFFQTIGATVAVAAAQKAQAQEKAIQGFEKAAVASTASEGWKPFSDRKLRVGIIGYGACKFGSAFSFQHHPNVEIVAVRDLFPERCAALAKEVSAMHDRFRDFGKVFT